MNMENSVFQLKRKLNKKDHTAYKKDCAADYPDYYWPPAEPAEARMQSSVLLSSSTTTISSLLSQQMQKESTVVAHPAMPQ